MKTKSPTSKQEKFAQLVASGNSLSDAYRGSFEPTKATPESIHAQASRLMANVMVSARVDLLRAECMSKTAEELFYGYQTAMAELDAAITFAKECKSPGALVAVLNLKQKISGLHVEERKNDRNPVAGMNSARVRAALEALAALKKARIGASQ